MIEIIAILLTGIGLGRLLRSSQIVRKFASGMTITVWILILALGFSVGSNPYIMSHLPSLGFESLIVCAFATGGSIFAVTLFKNYISKKHPDER